MKRAVAVTALAAALAVAGCGRKAPPHSPEGAFYPQHYPLTVLPSERPSGQPSEPAGEAQYRQLQERRHEEATYGPEGVLIAPRPAPPQTPFQDLGHPDVGSPSSTENKAP